MLTIRWPALFWCLLELAGFWVAAWERWCAPGLPGPSGRTVVLRPAEDNVDQLLATGIAEPRTGRELTPDPSDEHHGLKVGASLLQLGIVDVPPASEDSHPILGAQNCR